MNPDNPAVLVPGSDPPLWFHPGPTLLDDRYHPGRVPAPWTPQQAANAQAWQDSLAFDCHAHCPGGHGPLTATVDGLVCGECGHVQDWAWPAQVNDTPTGKRHVP